MLIINLLLLPTIASASVFTQEASVEYAGGQSAAFRDSAGYSGSATVGGIAASVINIALGLLGISFMGLLIYGGFTWMTAQGNEEEAKKAIKIIQMAVIGLIIIISAYSITHFVFSALNESTSQSGSLNP